ncbi:AraC family transcriptional regulator [Chitinophaga horti]|uniref:AraC family transcriptional regulator n=1 Tax=Chitinophaga horti TaxID=2920382 RepID=A0ABY6J6K1_9BACT|nr:AraC family transcriptional regulator [Chitinophaga horti]UYQ95299.1 AraC family transcriptional regulator [Chitinophaga horti]
MVVEQQLKAVGIGYSKVQLGDVALESNPSPAEMSSLHERLSALGFELLNDRRSTLVEKIKNIIIRLIHHTDGEEVNTKLSVILAEELHMDYHYLSSQFSAAEGVTIEKYAIQQRIEKAKELLAYGQLSLSEIAYALGYSSVQHLSQQFKKVTGQTPSQYKTAPLTGRMPLDKV